MTLAAPLRPMDGPVDGPADALAPLRLPDDLTLTPDQFAAVCNANPHAVLELDSSGHLIHMTPTGGETGARNTRLLARLLAWAEPSDIWMVFDSSSGFRLPDGSVLSPDASLLRRERWDALTQLERRGFPPLCPDLVVELASPGDPGPRGLTALRRKMAAYQANGAHLGWLLIPEDQTVEIWPAAGGGAPQRIEAASSLDAGPRFPGLHIDLQAIWRV